MTTTWHKQSSPYAYDMALEFSPASRFGCLIVRIVVDIA